MSTTSNVEKEINPDIEQAADILGQAMLEVAKPSKHRQSSVSKKRSKSRFFYTIPETVGEYIERQNAIHEASRKVASDIERIVSERTMDYEDELPPLLNQDIDHVREFFLQEINPLVIASSVGSNQAKDVIQQILGVNIDLEPYNQFDKVIRMAIRARIRRYVAEFIDVPYEDLLGVESPKEVIVVNGEGNEQRLPAARSVSGPLRK